MKEKKLTGYPSIDLPQSKNASFFEKNPNIHKVLEITDEDIELLNKKIAEDSAK